MLSSTRRPRLTLAATQAVCEGSAFLRNLVLARLIGVDEMGLAVALALGIRIFEMAGELGLDRLLVQIEDEAEPLDVGDHVLVHVGYAIQKVSDEDAAETWALIDEVNNV